MSSIYIHIPYCKQRCTYCNFYFQISQTNKIKLLKSIQQELIERKNYLKGEKITSIYFGGGTPSILMADEIKAIINSIYNVYVVKNDAEITIECNPDDITKTKLLSFEKMGVNRLSIGVQSFDDDDLKFMNRSHNAKSAIKSIKTAKKCGFKNITIDLIYGLPEQTLEKWEKNLNIMFSLGIQHFSAYSLTIEENTVLYHLIKNKKINLMSDKKILDQFNLLQLKARENEFIHYEISNFGKKSYFSRHNTGYWKNNHYLGVGPSAHSYNGKIRRWNVSSNEKYILNINTKTCYFEQEKLNLYQQYNEYILTSLRTMWGINQSLINERYGTKITSHFLKEIKKWEVKKYISVNIPNYTLTSKGKVFVDRISSDLFIVT